MSASSGHAETPPEPREPQDVSTGDGDERVAELLAHSIDVPVLAEAVEQQEAADAADTLEHLEEEEAADVLVAMDEHAAAEALAEMEGPLAAGVVEDLIDEGRVEYASLLVRLMAPDDAADLLQAVKYEQRDALLRVMPTTEATKLLRLAGYAEETAAGLMTTDFLALPHDITVAEATETIRGSALPAQVNHLPVVDDDGRLVGAIDLRSLLLNPAGRAIAELMNTEPKSIPPELDQEAVAMAFDRYDFYVMPVVDEGGVLLGIVTVDDVIDIIRAEQTEDVQRTVGAGPEEAVYSSVLDKFKGRFPWLGLSFLFMVPAAFIVLQFEGLISELAILAVLMPVIAAVAGNAGHQALAVTLRGIVLGEVRPDRVWRHVRRELIAGLFTGVGLGCAVAVLIAVCAAFVPGASWQLGVVVALSMALSMSAGTLAGAGIPLLMRRFGADPAQSSAIFLIMVTDALAFATFLGLSYVSIDWLLGSG